jgi:hypothetical protein
MEYLQEILKDVIINVGDLIVDQELGFVGVMVKRERRIDMFMDDLYFWHVKWIKNVDRHGDPPNKVDLLNYIEEEGLKLSIAVGAINIYSSERGEHEF